MALWPCLWVSDETGWVRLALHRPHQRSFQEPAQRSGLLQRSQKACHLLLPHPQLVGLRVQAWE